MKTAHRDSMWRLLLLAALLALLHGLPARAEGLHVLTVKGTIGPASAGTYILYASHIAAMAPATNLGAATPVELVPEGMPGGAPDKKGDKPAEAPPQDARAKKAVNDAAAYIRGLAERHGRNAEWAERAVREAVSLPAEEALQLKVVDVVATDLADLLRQLHGREVKLAAGEITLDTAGLAVTRVEQDWRSRLLAVIGDPSIAYILLLLGIYGLIYEFMNPGMLFPGVVGGICLLLALFALQLMPVSYVGLALIILGIAMMAAEAFLPSFGALGLGGIVAFVLGSVMLIDTDLPGYGVSWGLIAPLAGVSALLSFVVGGMALRARRRPVLTGGEELPGSEGEFQASEKLLAAAEILARKPQAMQLRYLQTLTGIAGDKTNTIIFPVPGEFMDLLRPKPPGSGD